MDRQSRSTISIRHAEREDRRAERIRGNPSKEAIAALWERPLYQGPSAMRNWGPHYVRAHRGTTENLNDVWKSLPPDDRAPYLAMSKPYLDELAAKIAAFNARIPLSPSVPSEPTSDMSDDAEVLEERRGAQRWNRYRRDHPRACGGAVTPVPVEPFRFLDLPIHIRKKVYSLVIGTRMVVEHQEDDGSADGVEGPIDLRLFVVSKGMRDETMGWFFENQIFDVFVADDGIVGALPLFMRKSTEERTRWPVKKLKMVNVGIRMHKSIQLPFLGALVDRVCEVLAGCEQLTEVKFTPVCDVYSYKPVLDKDMDGLLERFTRVRGVGSVRWTTDRELAAIFPPPSSRIIGTETQKTRVGEVMMS